MKKKLEKIVDGSEPIKCKSGEENWLLGKGTLVGISSNGPVFANISNEKVKLDKDSIIKGGSWISSLGVGTAFIESDKISKMSKEEMTETMLSIMNYAGASPLVKDASELRWFIARMAKSVMGERYQDWVKQIKSEVGSWDEGKAIEGFEES